MCSLTWILLNKYNLKNFNNMCIERVEQPKRRIDKSSFLSVVTGRSTRTGRIQSQNRQSA